MYKCNSCKEGIKEPVVEIYREESEYFGRPVYEPITIYKCPHCGSDDIEEVQACEICGSATSDYFKHFCDFCHTNLEYDLEKIKEQYKLTQDKLEDMIAEHFGW